MSKCTCKWHHGTYCNYCYIDLYNLASLINYDFSKKLCLVCGHKSLNSLLLCMECMDKKSTVKEIENIIKKQIKDIYYRL